MTQVSVIQGDIVRESGVDAIVTDAIESLRGGEGVDASVHRAGGVELDDACLWVPEISPGLRCPVGEARLTYGGALGVRYVIHTVAPRYYDHENAEKALASCYVNSLELAERMGFSRVSFPALGCGVKEFPHPISARIGIRAARNREWNLEAIRFVIYENFGYEAWLRALELA